MTGRPLDPDTCRMQVHVRKMLTTMQHTSTTPRWSTTSFGGSADTSPMELDALGQHLSACRGQQGRFLALRCAAERLHVFVAARLVTSLVAAAVVLIGIGAVLLHSGPG
jgi:hypothetical protein